MDKRMLVLAALIAATSDDADGPPLIMDTYEGKLLVSLLGMGEEGTLLAGAAFIFPDASLKVQWAYVNPESNDPEVSPELSTLDDLLRESLGVETLEEWVEMLKEDGITPEAYLDCIMKDKGRKWTFEQWVTYGL
jgi:hypothetical protein